MKIALLIEGETERVFLPYLRVFLNPRLPAKMPRLVTNKYDGRIPKQEKLKRVVETLLRGANPDADHVIALTDVYTGSNDFQNATDAKQKMRSWVGPNDRFHAHVAQHDFEAWLLPYWPAIQELAKHNRTVPAGPPESVNHNHPPPYHIKESFQDRPGAEALYENTRCQVNLAGKRSERRSSSLPRTASLSQHNPDTVRWRSHLGQRDWSSL
jgi:hypothetical protein